MTNAERALKLIFKTHEAMNYLADFRFTELFTKRHLALTRAQLAAVVRELEDWENEL